MNRRAFVQRTSMAAGLITCFPAVLSAIERQSVPGKLERRALGKTGEKLSVLGFGGLVLNESTPAQAAEWVRLAYDAGVNYFDVAPSYGNSEEQMGPALEPYRKQVFLACKTAERRKVKAAEELNRSLQRLRTDYFDLYQLHAVTSPEEVEIIFGPGGAMELLQEAKKAGKARFLGFSAHSVEAALALMDRYPFDSILFPVNYATWHAGNFGPQVLAHAQEKGVGILALKAMAKRPWPKDASRAAAPKCWYEPMTNPDEALQGLRFTLSHPVTAAIHPADENCLKVALRVLPKFTPLAAGEAEAIKQQALKEAPLFRYPREDKA